MSEPKQKARTVEEVAPGLLHWTVYDDRIEARSDAWALTHKQGAVLIDPLPIEEAKLGRLPRPTTICLTIQSHQRSAWRYRKRFGARVYAPTGADGLEERPDVWYHEGSSLPGGLRALHAPGPTEASFVLLHRNILFLGDLLARGDDGPLRFVPNEFMDAPELARASVRGLVDLAIDILCPGHGAPLTDGARDALRQALEEDARAAAPPPG
jgi:glyoxylase-like metal-dependent hydrolase (beta-lactamase superfamily II)